MRDDTIGAKGQSYASEWFWAAVPTYLKHSQPCREMEAYSNYIKPLQ